MEQNILEAAAKKTLLARPLGLILEQRMIGLQYLPLRLTKVFAFFN